MSRPDAKIISALIILTSALTLPLRGEVRFVCNEAQIGLVREADGTATATFTFVNTGPDTVGIGDVSGSCRCTEFKYSRKPVAPNDSATITAMLDVKGMMGDFEKRVYVRFTGERAPAMLKLVGTVLGTDSTLMRKYKVQAGRLFVKSDTVEFGKMHPGDELTAFVDIYNASTVDVTPEFGRLPKGVSIETTPIPPGQERGIGITVKAPRHPKPLTIMLNDHKIRLILD